MTSICHIWVRSRLLLSVIFLASNFISLFLPMISLSFFFSLWRLSSVICLWNRKYKVYIFSHSVQFLILRRKKYCTVNYYFLLDSSWYRSCCYYPELWQILEELSLPFLKVLEHQNMPWTWEHIWECHGSKFVVYTTENPRINHLWGQNPSQAKTGSPGTQP